MTEQTWVILTLVLHGAAACMHIFIAMRANRRSKESLAALEIAIKITTKYEALINAHNIHSK